MFEEQIKEDFYRVMEEMGYEMTLSPFGTKKGFSVQLEHTERIIALAKEVEND